MMSHSLAVTKKEEMMKDINMGTQRVKGAELRGRGRNGSMIRIQSHL
jgi:hypothetical protein